jgi:hypothetical protein
MKKEAEAEGGENKINFSILMLCTLFLARFLLIPKSERKKFSI